MQFLQVLLSSYKVCIHTILYIHICVAEYVQHSLCLTEF